MLRDFDLAFDYMIKNEGGIKLHTVKGDPGGTTFAGIAFNRWPKHSIWADIKRLEVKEGEEVELGVKEDGIIGPNTLKGIERFADQARTYDEAATRDTFTIAKVEYYTNLCNKNKNLNKFLKGWLNRTLRGYHEL